MLKSIAFLAAWTALSTFPVRAEGPGDLGITPHRIVFAGRDRTAQLTLINQGAETTTYRIGFLQMRMGEDGQLTEISEPGSGDRFADALLRFSPRQVTLEPGGAQTVRLLLHKPDGLAAGEYRSHLVFQSVPKEGGTDVEALDAPAQGVEVRLIPIFRIAIPVLVREGKLDAEAALSDLEWHPPAKADAPPRVSFLLHRTGSRSLFGDVTVTCGGETLAQIAGLALYSPSAARRVELALEAPPAATLSGKRLEVRFEEQVAVGSAKAKAEIVLP